MSQFWKPSTDREENSQILFDSSKSNYSISDRRRTLPIFRHREKILYAVEKFRAVILVGETGCGKTTQIPQYLYESGWSQYGGIICTQPSKSATISASTRVAEEMGSKVGYVVGYAGQYDSKCTLRTKVLFCTNSWLVMETMQDPLLSKYSVIIIDEAHERKLETDVLLGLLKKILKKRVDLHLIVCSATMNAKQLRLFFEFNDYTEDDPRKNSSVILTIQDRIYDIDLLYLDKPAPNYVRKIVEVVIEIHRVEVAGDILVFVPNQDDIRSITDLINDHDAHNVRALELIPLHNQQPANALVHLFTASKGKSRRVVISTPIAETAITIPGVKYVIDSGFTTLNYFDHYSSVEVKVVCPVSRAVADQRAGRAGRTQYGKCFRLMTERDYLSLQVQYPPEMQRMELSGVVLRLKSLGVSDVLHFDFVSPPAPEAMIYALELLYSLGALDDACNITPLGMAMAEMPVGPHLAKALLSSFDFGCGEEMLSVAAMCAVDSPFIHVRNKANAEAQKRLADCIAEFVHLDGDHLTSLNIYNGFVEAGCSAQWCDSMCLQFRILARAQEIRGHLLRSLSSHSADGQPLSSCGEDSVAIRKCLVSGYFANVAQLSPDGNYRTVRGQRAVTPHPSSVFANYGAPPEWVLFHDAVCADGVNIRDVTRIEPTWLLELAKHYYAVKGR